MLVGLDGRRLEVRLQLRAFALVGERDEGVLLHQPGSDKCFCRGRRVQRGVGFLPLRKLIDPGGERDPIARFDFGLGELALHGVVDLRDPLLQ